jgi:purine-nucleoside/S-methyl-5'-thioadenosine phosphorylase / adenosine deaminase
MRTARIGQGAHGQRARIAAAIGPAIARKSHEVDDAFLRRFAEFDPENARFFTPDRFFSYRRATHKGEPTYGRQLSLIALSPSP